MKSLLIKYIVLFFGIILIIDVLGGIFFKRNFHNITFGFYGKINNSLKSDSDLIILGSSRAMHHYNPEILSKTMNLSCYNSGFGGYGLFLNYAVLSERIKIKIPKVVILDLSPNTMIIGENSYSKLDKLLPYYDKYPSFNEIVQLNSKFSKLEVLSNLYIHNSTLYDFIKNQLNDSKNKNAFDPLNGQLNKKYFKPFFLQDVEYFDKNKILYLNKIINLCKKNNIKLIGVVSPTYLKFDRNNRIINELKSIFHNENLVFFDYSNYSKLYQDPKYFIDQLHMNELGAEKFSEELANKINI